MHALILGSTEYLFITYFIQKYKVEDFVEKECIPREALYEAQLGKGEERWNSVPPVIEELKTKARSLGLWNMFLPKNHFKEGAGFSNLEYGLMAEYLGRCRVASEATNNAAPDTGNMEVLAKYANESQKQQWLAPLLDGRIRSAFLMTEPDVASSDATNIQLDIRREGNEYLINGQVRIQFFFFLFFSFISFLWNSPILSFWLVYERRVALLTNQLTHGLVIALVFNK